MSELERARAHLLDVQNQLQWARQSSLPGSEYVRRTECCVLAALSWLWEEQQKARAENKAEFSKWLDGIIAERFA